MSQRTFTFASARPTSSGDPLLQQIAAAVPLQYLHFTLAAPQPPSGTAYTYQIKALDGRVWTQTITFDGPSDANPYMTFAVVPGWKLTEFAQQRQLRDLLVQLFVRHGATVVKFDYS